jgi:hypothetical protein
MDFGASMFFTDDSMAHAIASLESEKADTILPVLDTWAELIRRVNG